MVAIPFNFCWLLAYLKTIIHHQLARRGLFVIEDSALANHLIELSICFFFEVGRERDLLDCDGCSHCR